MEFKKVDINDAGLITRLLQREPSQQLIACFEAYYLWRDLLDVEYTVEDGWLLFKLCYNNDCSFFFPSGSGDLRQIVEKLDRYARSAGMDFKIIKARKEQAALLEKAFHGKFRTMEIRDNYEYIYSTGKFREYRGAALQAKRNFVNYANKNYNWKYEHINTCNIDECKHFSQGFKGDGSFVTDNEALLIALNEWEKLSVNGGIIKIEGEITALFIAAMLSGGKTGAGLFLRGKHEMKGVIPLLYKEFFRANPQYEFVNLAEDLGIEGLRKNKLSFNPDRLLELYDITEIKL